MGAFSEPGSRASMEPQSSQGLHPSGFDPSRFVWHSLKGRYASGHALRAGGLTLGTVFYDGISRREIVHRHRIETLLPGLKPKTDRFATAAEAMAALEGLTLAWIDRLFSDSDGSANAARP